MSDQIGELMNRTKQKDFRALARLLSILEREGPKVLKGSRELLTPSHPAFRVGITGPPGAGKSTLIGRMIGELRARGLTVGVIAVDPSSPFTQGAVLGDRIRYVDHFSDPGVFIRSLGSRGSLGGLSASTYLMVRAFDLARFDVLLIETVGVGQTELEVMNIADWVGVVLVPESGDSIQGMKAGLLEIANLFIVNKADRPGAEGFMRELEAAMHLDSGHSYLQRLGVDPSDPHKAEFVLPTVAVQGKGIQELVDRILGVRDTTPWRQARLGAQRLQLEAQALLRLQADREIAEKTATLKTADDFISLFS